VIASSMNFVDVADAATGHLLAAERGKAGERYILGGRNMSWPALVDRVAELSEVHFPVLVMPPEIARVARIREALGIPGPMSVEGYELMSKDWRFSSKKAQRELGYEARPIDETLLGTIDWYMELIESGVFGDQERSGLSSIAGVMRRAAGLGLLRPVRIGQGILGRRVVAGV
jgi:dihydroflavonol-4-reductase